MKLVKVQQRLCSAPIRQIETTVRAELQKLGPVPQGSIALTGGSRGIANQPEIFRSVGKWLREQGADPFVAPCMGSHNGGTAEGQKAMLESLGLSEQAIEMPIHSSMDVCEIGSVRLDSNQSEVSVWMDRHCFEATAVLVINRIKLHTSFGGPPYGNHFESGLIKMLTVGMGKIEGAKSFHTASTIEKTSMLRLMGEQVLGTDKIWGGLAILEDGYDQTAELHGITSCEILEREPHLLAHYAEHYYPRLPFEELNSLIVESMGKNYSGTGMDTNILGRRGLEDADDPASPSVQCVAALDLTDVSQGNAVGVGLADVITKRLASKINADKTNLNALTAGGPAKGVVPHVVEDDQEVYNWITSQVGNRRCVVIPNTLHLDKFYASLDLIDELQQLNQDSPDRFEFGESIDLLFKEGQHLLRW